MFAAPPSYRPETAIRARLRTAVGLLPTGLSAALIAQARALPLFSDWRSLVRYGRLWWPLAKPQGRVVLRLRALDGRELVVRARTADRDTVVSTFSHGFHVPDPGQIRDDAALIWDLGANIGTTMSHLAARYPTAHIVGLELNDDNIELCRRNVAVWGSRCEVVCAAAWPTDGVVSYRRDAVNEEAYRVLDEDGLSTDATPSASISLNTLLQRGSGKQVDYVKMDIEGAERAVLREHTEWASRVRALKVEVHLPYTVTECVSDLRALGFDASVDPRHPAAVSGRRLAVSSV